MGRNASIHTADPRYDRAVSKCSQHMDKFQQPFDLEAKQNFVIASRGSSGWWSTYPAAGHVSEALKKQPNPPSCIVWIVQQWLIGWPAGY
jgi:hypothetical protein